MHLLSFLAYTGKEIEGIITVFFVQATLFATGLVTIYFKMKSAAAAREKSIKDQIRRMTDEVKAHNDASVQKLNGMLTYLIHSFGAPAWLKVARMGPGGEVEFRMLEVNEDYASTFGISRMDYIGKTDLEAGWPFRDAQVFRQHDLTVWASGEPLEVEESAAGSSRRFRKVRVQSPDGTLKGIFGFCIDAAPRANH